MRRTTLTLALLLLAFACAAPGQDGIRDGEPQAVDKGDLILIPVPGSPVVALRVVVDCGSMDDPPGLEGLCALTMRTAAEGGTPSLTQAEVADRLYPMDARVEVQVDRETSVFSGRVQREDLDEFYPIFWDLITQPRFAQDDFERARDASLSSLQNDLKGNDIETLGKEGLQAILFEGTAYAHPPVGTESGLERVSREDLVSMHHRAIVRSRVHIGVAGGYESAFAQRVRGDLAALPQGEGERVRPRIDAARGRGLEVLLIDAPTRSTAISVGFLHDVRRDDPDYWPLYLAATAFGEHRTFLGRLQQEMRGARGLNYGDYAYLDHFEQDRWGRFARPNLWRQSQYFSIWVRPVRPENGLFALRQAIWELRSLIEGGLTMEEFELTREHLRSVSQLWRQTLSRRAGLAMDDAHYGTEDGVESLRRALDSMSLEDVNGALRRRLTWRDLKAALVCAAADSLRTLLYSGGPSPIVYSGGDAPERVRAKDAQIMSSPWGIDEVRVVSASALFR